jgi:hypothetical protein
MLRASKPGLPVRSRKDPGYATAQPAMALHSSRFINAPVMARGYIEHANLQCMPSFNAATLDSSMVRVVTHSGRATVVSLSTYTIASIRSPSRSRDWKSSETTCPIAPAY